MVNGPYLAKEAALLGTRTLEQQAIFFAQAIRVFALTMRV